MTWSSAEKLGQLAVDGYLVNNNVFSAEAGSQSIHAYGPDSWYVDANHSRTDVRPGSIKSYPDTQRNFKDRPIDSFTQITAEYATTSPTVGEYDWAFDVWVGGIGGKSTAEVMFWVQHRYNGVLPPKNALESTTVTIDGQGFIAWRRKNGNGGDYIALVMTPMKAAGSLDLLAVFRWLTSKGWLKGSDLVAAVEFGVEIANTAGGPQTFTLDNYTLTAK